MNDRDTFLDSVESTKRILKDEFGEKASVKEIRDIMYHDNRMRYRKIKRCSIHVNSIKNLVLRQQYAIQFLELVQQKKNFINIDETWLGMSDFRRQKWRVHGSTNSVPQL